MRVDELDYHLPPDLIAQTPSAQREDARLMVVNRSTGAIDHRHVRDLPALLRPADCLVLNQTRVIPAKFDAIRATGGRISGLFVGENAPGDWNVLLAGRGRLRKGDALSLADGGRTMTLISRGERGAWRVDVSPPDAANTILDAIGRMPLPPYIRRGADEPPERDADDRARYQTVFAREPGAVAAPTAGLHFSDDLLGSIRAAGVETTCVVLHVGQGTFAPVTVDDLNDHAMHSERYELGEDAVAAIERCRARRGRVVAVGTTTVRVLESRARDDGRLLPARGETDILIQPPYRFRAIDALMTNFHLPRSTLLALVMALAGPALIRRAYAEAIAERYRFFSFGDAMLIV